MPNLINWELASNPLNWVMIVLMLYIGFTLLHLITGSGLGAGPLGEVFPS